MNYKEEIHWLVNDVFKKVHPYVENHQIQPIPQSLYSQTEVPIISKDLMFVKFDVEFISNSPVMCLGKVQEFIKGMGYMGYNCIMDTTEVKSNEMYTMSYTTILLKVDLTFTFPVIKRVTRPSMRVLLSQL